MQASSAAFSRCSLPGVMFHASPEQSCCGTSSQLVPSLLRYQVYTAPSSLSVLPLTFAVKQPSVRMLSTSSALVTTAVCAAVSGAASSVSITRVRAVSGVAAGSAAGVGSASISGSGAGGSGSAGAIAAADSAVAGSSSAANTALAMPAAIQQASSTANRRFFMYGSSFAGFPCGACPPAGSIGSIPSAARGTRRGLLSAKRSQKKTHHGQKPGCVFFVGEGFIPPGVFAAAASSTLPALRRHLPCKGRQGTLAPSARGLRPQAVGERTYRQAAVYTTVTSVSQSPVMAYLPLPAGIK